MRDLSDLDENVLNGSERLFRDLKKHNLMFRSSQHVCNESNEFCAIRGETPIEVDRADRRAINEEGETLDSPE